MTLLDELSAPVVLAPLAGGPATPALAAAVSDAGGFGFVASGYLTAQAVAEQIDATRKLTTRAFGVNLFIPGPGPADQAVYGRYADRIAAWARRHGAEAGAPRYDRDDFEAKVELLVGDPVAAVSFTFGCPPVDVVERLRAAGSEVWVTVTSPEEADEAAAGADVLVVQGAEAGGHRASFVDRAELPAYGLLALLQLVAARQSVPLVAAGGIATGGALAAVLAAGANAAQLGTAFMLCPEAGTSPAHREALRSPCDTALTRAFTGRLARGIRNSFMVEHDAEAPIAYPEIHHLTAPIRRTAREGADASALNLWAGEAHQLARETPAGELVRELVGDARAGGESLARILG